MQKQVNKKWGIKEIITFISQFIWVGLVLCYIFGFIAWNSFLNNYSFFEYELLQTRFISAGILFLISFIFFYLIIYFIIGSLIVSSLPKKLSKTVHFLFKKQLVRYCFISILLILWLLIFPQYLFNKIPPKWGGAEPFVTALITTPEQIKYLSNFNIESVSNAKKPKVETVPLCNLYQNKEIIIVGIEYEEGYRVLILRQDQILGHNQRKRFLEIEEEICKPFLKWKYNINGIGSSI